MYQNLSKKAVGTHLVNKNAMTRTSYRQVLLILGILVALIVILLFNSTLISDQSAILEPSINKINDLAHYPIPNMIFYLF